MNISKMLLRLMGWKVSVSVPNIPQCIICVAPHTSNEDFILCELAIRSVGRRSGFLMKKSWFFWPLGPIFRAMGGIPVDRSHGSPSLVAALVERFRTTSRLVVAITPEGTRSRNPDWRTGFLRIATEAHVSIMLAVVDFKTKHIFMHEQFYPTGDIAADMRAIKKYYAPYQGKHPENFTTGDE